MKVSDFIADFLEIQNVSHVFELSGGMITHILDSLSERGKINIVTMHHEQSTSFAADAYGRLLGVPGVALATSGPGAVNLLTGIGSCYFDSSPAVFITGQVNTHEKKRDKKIRQLGFQETDIISMARPITKAVFEVENAETIQDIFYKAFEIAISGRPGPVLIDIPMNIQRMDIEVTRIEKVVKSESNILEINEGLLNKLEKDIQNAKSPLILAGRGIDASLSIEQFQKFVNLTSIPVITSLLAIDTIEYENPLRVGFIGAYGNRWANLAIGECDLMIVIGSRLDIRQTGADAIGFKSDKLIYHIDCESEEMNNRVQGCITVQADINYFLNQANAYFETKSIIPKLEWCNKINGLKILWKDTDELKKIQGINPNIFVHLMSKSSTEAKCFVADVGSHQMWVAQSIELNKNQKFITSGGMGAMGFALPAAIGSCFATSRSPIVTVIGDGSFQLNIQELQTIVRNKLPIKIVIFNNRSLGMIRQFQDSYFEGRHQSTVWGYDAPDFEAISIAYKIPALTISEESEIELALTRMWEEPLSPFLLQVMIDKTANVYPKIAFGKPITEMEPFVKPIEMEGT